MGTNKRSHYTISLWVHEYDVWIEKIRRGVALPPEVVGFLLGRAKVVYLPQEITTQVLGLGFTTKTENRLRERGYDTLEKVIATHPKEFTKLPGVGRHTMYEIWDKLKEMEMLKDQWDFKRDEIEKLF